MKIVLQRCNYARVTAHDNLVGEIGNGMLLLVCFEKDDGQGNMEQALKKVLNLRIFDDVDGKVNLNIQDVKGEILCISQFTLSWDGSKGNRPSFDKSLAPGAARLLYEQFCRELNEVVPTKKGSFGSMMDVELSNNGPVTFHLSF